MKINAKNRVLVQCLLVQLYTLAFFSLKATRTHCDYKELANGPKIYHLFVVYVCLHFTIITGMLFSSPLLLNFIVVVCFSYIILVVPCHIKHLISYCRIVRSWESGCRRRSSSPRMRHTGVPKLYTVSGLGIRLLRQKSPPTRIVLLV